MTLETDPQQIQLDCKGLYTMPNSLSKVPAGSLLQAENVVVDYNGLLSVRRGIKQFGVSFQTLTGNANTEVFGEFFYKDSKLAWYGDATLADINPARNNFAYDSDGLGTWVNTTMNVPSPAYVLTDTYRSAQSNDNIYFTSNAGILKADDPSRPLYSAGGLPGLDGQAVLSDSSGFMATNTEVAYRMTWTFTDFNNNAVEGTPSTRVVIANNSGGSRNVTLTFTIPHGTTIDYQYKIYRSIMSATGTTEPADELQLVITGNPTSTDLTNGFFTVKDTTPESELGAFLYTNSGQEGISQANTIPPLSNDMCFFFGYMIYGSCTTQQKFLLSLLSAETPLGLAIGDTFTVTRGSTTFTLTAHASEVIASGYFKLFTGGDPGSDILQTKLSLIHVLNRYAQLLVYAFDASDVNSATSLPGDFYLQEQGIGGSPFNVFSSNTTAWNPPLNPSIGVPSLAGGGKGMGFCSKFQQPEAVPLSNTINVGNPNFEWLRVLPLRNSVVVLKADGLFQLTGTTFPFTVTTLDTGTILTAPESPVVMNNQVFAYTNQGIVGISETGPGILSRPIENILQRISSYLYVQFPQKSFGAAYETDRKYIFSTISENDNYVKATIQYVYDTITESWTTYTYPIALWDIRESPTEHRLYLTSADPAYPYVFQERKSFTRLDYADIELPVTIVAYDNTQTPPVVTLSSTAAVTVGWSLAQLVLVGGVPTSILNLSVITRVIDATHINVTDAVNWDLSGISLTTVEQPIPVSVAYCPIIGSGVASTGATVAGNPGIIKFFKEIQFFFQNVDFTLVNVSIASDFVAGGAPMALIPTTATVGWGQFAWGQVPWGGNSEFTVQSIRTYIPLSARRAHWLNISLNVEQAMTSFTFGGAVLTYTPVTTRSK